MITVAASAQPERHRMVLQSLSFYQGKRKVQTEKKAKLKRKGQTGVERKNGQ